jgi:hypothetical protein
MVAALGVLATGAIAHSPVGSGFAVVAGGLIALAPQPPRSRRVTTLAWAISLAAALVPLWQAALVLALGGWLVGWRTWPAGWSWGSVPLLPTLLTAAVTPGALVGWYLAVRPDLADVVETYLAVSAPAWLILLGAAGFALVNAALEEAVWRGILQPELAERFGPGLAVGLQATSFGAAHAWGFPRGVAGVALVTAWGVLLGLLRARSRGLLAPWLAHVAADAVIAAIVLTLVAPG